MLSLTGLSKSFYGRDTNKPRIILVGSSNLEQNYDYAFLNEHFHEYDVVGCNLNEPSGVFPTLHKLKLLNPKLGDILVFCFPHSFYEEDKHFPVESFKKRGVNSTVFLNYIKEFPINALMKFVSHTTKDSYYLVKNKRPVREEFEVTYMEQPEVMSDSLYTSCWVNPEDNFTITSLTYEEEYIEELFEYVSKEFKGDIYFRFPAIRKDEYNINQDRLSHLKETGLFINDFDSSIYQNEYWFNQWYHLNKCGRDLSTPKTHRRTGKQTIIGGLPFF